MDAWLKGRHRQGAGMVCLTFKAGGAPVSWGWGVGAGARDPAPTARRVLGFRAFRFPWQDRIRV